MWWGGGRPPPPPPPPDQRGYCMPDKAVAPPYPSPKPIRQERLTGVDGCSLFGVFEQHVADVVDDIQPHEVGQFQRPHG